MSTVTEIREAIEKLNESDRNLLVTELYETMVEKYENSREFLAAIEESEADIKAGRVYSIEEVRTMMDKWISESSSQKVR